MRLVTDLYEMTMAASYLRRGMTAPATFSLFVRRMPPSRGFLVAAGVEDLLDTLETFEVRAEDVVDLARLVGCRPEVFEPLVGLRFTGDVLAVPEGRVVLADEPLLEVTAPLPQAQLVESVALNAVTYQSAIASKAVRCVVAAAGRPVVDFALRRTHGLEAADAVARVTALAGFAATSNIHAAARYGLVATGTMAHSYVQAIGDDEAAFRAFAADAPVRPTFLVDTFDLRTGLEAAARVVRDLGLEEVAAVRVDSGDLAEGARLARDVLDAAGLPGVRVVVSGGLDEHRIDALVRAGAPVDVFAVGTAVGVSDDAPALDSAYKLVEYAGRPVLKLSTGKRTWPGAKQVWRAEDVPGPRDVLALRGERGPVRHGRLLGPAMVGGRRVLPRQAVSDGAQRLARDLARLDPAALRTTDPQPPRCAVSEALAAASRRLARAATTPSAWPPAGRTDGADRRPAATAPA